jgi:hypothetical protein
VSLIEVLDPQVAWADGQCEDVERSRTFQLVELAWREWLVAEQLPPGPERSERMASLNWAAWRVLLADGDRQTVH